MLIANFKAKFFPPMTQNNSNVDNAKVISKKLESISANFKSTPTIISRDLRIEGEIISYPAGTNRILFNDESFSNVWHKAVLADKEDIYDHLTSPGLRVLA